MKTKRRSCQIDICTALASAADVLTLARDPVMVATARSAARVLRRLARTIDRHRTAVAHRN